ncbi:MAG: class I mannose-6-phosphate isomerase [Oscillospiraceae bacterium]|nr:class I mannose-6-phosphate isomerase [Oscillospiraceae bacterium]
MCIKNLYPLKLKPVLKDAIWGGNRLASEYKKSDNPNKKIAESWELTVHKNGVNIIENGEYANQTIEDLFKLDKSIVSPDYKSDKFPILIKFIDAEQNLSVQVHPDDEYAKKHENEFGKTEMWYIIDCKPGAKIVYGLNNNYTREDLQNLIDNNKFENCLNYIEVKRGDVYFIPAGLVHAIGEGILIAEIQQNSDTTYRFYDYSRVDTNGNPRELHIDKALDVCIKTKTEYVNPKIKDDKIPWLEVLSQCEYFFVSRFDLKTLKKTNINCPGYFCSVICLDGKGEIIYKNKKYKIIKGDSYFFPAGINNIKITGSIEFILTTLSNIK